MDLKQIVQGQKDWVKTVNSNFDLLDKSASDWQSIVLLDGWKDNGAGMTHIKKVPLLGGMDLVVCQLDVTLDSIKNNVWGDIAQWPDGYGSNLNYMVGTTPLENDGHLTGVIRFYSTDKLSYHYVPVSATPDGAKAVINQTIMWVR